MDDIFTALGKSLATIEFKLDGTILTANQNFLSVMGYTLSEVKGKHHSMFTEPAFAASQEYKDFWKKLNEGQFFSSQFKRIGKGGKEVWMEASYNPILDMNGKPFKVTKLAADITNRKENLIIADEFEKNIGSVIQTLSTSASQMESTSHTLAAAAEETSVQSNTVAAATEELSASVNEIAMQVTNSTRVVNEAVDEAQKSEVLVA